MKRCGPFPAPLPPLGWHCLDNSRSCIASDCCLPRLDPPAARSSSSGPACSTCPPLAATAANRSGTTLSSTTRSVYAPAPALGPGAARLTRHALLLLAGAQGPRGDGHRTARGIRRALRPHLLHRRAGAARRAPFCRPPPSQCSSSARCRLWLLQISFDVFPTVSPALHRSTRAPRAAHRFAATAQGWDKTYCLQFLEPRGFKEIHFFGDKTYEVRPTPTVLSLGADTSCLGLLVAGRQRLRDLRVREDHWPLGQVVPRDHGAVQGAVHVVGRHTGTRRSRATQGLGPTPPPATAPPRPCGRAAEVSWKSPEQHTLRRGHGALHASLRGPVRGRVWVGGSGAPWVREPRERTSTWGPKYAEMVSSRMP